MRRVSSKGGQEVERVSNYLKDHQNQESIVKKKVLFQISLKVVDRVIENLWSAKLKLKKLILKGSGLNLSPKKRRKFYQTVKNPRVLSQSR